MNQLRYGNRREVRRLRDKIFTRLIQLFAMITLLEGLLLVFDYNLTNGIPSLVQFIVSGGIFVVIGIIWIILDDHEDSRKITKYVCMICGYENLIEIEILNHVKETHTEYIIEDASKNYILSHKVRKGESIKFQEK